ncbi:MAG TPA: hypothetical protein P5056_02975 [Candidatus Paceibacterota bacterium]|nr:hypothetical protein [Candidatus Paceibacterota bacterium]
MEINPVINRLKVLSVVIGSFFLFLFFSINNWSTYDLGLVIEQTAFIIFFASKIIRRNYKKNIDDTLLAFVAIVAFAGMLFGLVTELPLLECVALAVCPVLSGLLFGVATPYPESDDREAYEHFISYAVLQVCFVLMFGSFSHYSGGWVFWY